MPGHLAIIMDGNGRWARQKNLPRSEGHNQGTKTARAIVEESRRLGIPHLTLYAFSKENWARPKEEVSFLFSLLSRFLQKELQSLIKQDIRLNILGEPGDLPLATRKVLEHACTKTKTNKSMTLNLALNYSGRCEIIRACRLIVQKGLDPDRITEEGFKDFLYTAGQPDPDLIIRTSGELRISNYLLYQCAYSELYFTKTLWPDFTPQELWRALEDYAHRQRRLGRVEPA
ncbi:polyprenyl diphosphate synthase [Desulfonatronovibrio hydrogenovorans]|uniref:polyprenyl diphosphate synthase n=1 Tax=Desulfonatronovibrio hydrogenovorans TaxID=53245 RepID=UPI000AC19500